jgi:hypothetical protein
LTIKQALASISPMAVHRQSLYLITDGRAGISTSIGCPPALAHTKHTPLEQLELPNRELLRNIVNYSTLDPLLVHASLTPIKAEIHLAVMLDLNRGSAATFLDTVSVLPNSAVQLGTGFVGHEDNTLNYSVGVAFVPAFPQLVVLTSHSSNQVRVYNKETRALLCKLGEHPISRSNCSLSLLPYLLFILPPFTNSLKEKQTAVRGTNRGNFDSRTELQSVLTASMSSSRKEGITACSC